MKRNAIAVLLVAGAVVPLAVAALFLFGCCVLPFHQTVHSFMPACHLAASVMSGHEEHHPATPPEAKPVKRFTTVVPQAIRLAAAAGSATLAAPPAQSSYRDVIAHGALRCDRDVGLHVLDRTLLI